MAEPVVVEFPDRRRAALPSCPYCDRAHSHLGILALAPPVRQGGIAYNGYIYCPRTESRVLLCIPPDVLSRWDTDGSQAGDAS